ncbi:ATP-binding protein [Fibrella arboris]|uniref:ATP-binding protein n=1 Tax=Fibrella arboris TaxID=3242486 RepID=UPI0035222284
MNAANCRACFILPVCCWVSMAVAQIKPPRQTLLTTTDGLPNSHITGMVQDKAGFIWISTADGLARYDGYSVKTFRHMPGNANSLADNIIRQLEETATGQLLISTESGTFQLFDPATERFSSLLDASFLAARKAVISQCHLSADGRHAWGLMPGVQLIDYDISRKTIRVYDATALVGEPNTLHDFVLTATGYIYSTCSKGLFQLNTRTGQKRFIPLPHTPPNNGFSSADGHEVVEGPNGQIVLFNYRAIALYDPAQNRFRTIPLPDLSRSGPISYTLKTLSDNHIYLGYLNQLYRVEAAGKLTLLPALPRIQLRDRSGALWSVNPRGGLTRYDANALPFTFQPTQKSFVEDLLEQHLGVLRPDSLEVWSVARWPRLSLTANGNGYLIDPFYLYRYVPGQRALTEITSLRATNGAICCKLCLKVTRSGRIWLYTNDKGLVDADLGGAGAYLHPNSRLPIKRANPGYDAGDIQPMGRSVWVGSQYGLGLFRYDIDRGRYDAPLLNDPATANSLPGNTINCLATDPLDSTVLWIGTAGSGLCRLNTRTMTFRRLGESEGFPNGTIQTMEADRQGFIWCATSKGLVRIKPSADPEQLTWRHFTTDDGLATNEFSRTSSAVLPDGKLVFGTLAGRIVVDPAVIHDDLYDPPMVLTSLKVNNVLVDANTAGSPLPAPINALSELRLDYTQNFLTFGFAGLHYAKMAKIRYRYRLVGVDENWVNAANQLTANYTQLAPGTYQLLINCSRADGQWSRQTKHLTVVILPPIWATWWAYGLYALAVAGLAWGVIRFRVRQLQQQQALARNHQEAEQLRALDEVKTRFFSNITHEFRTLLSLILLPTEKLLQEDKHDSYTRRTLVSIYNNAQQLLRLINQLLDLSKLEGNNMGVSFSRGNGIAFIRHCVDLFRPMAEAKRIELRLTTDTPSGEWLFDADKWEKIISNLLANALKFTPSGGQVGVTIRLVSPDRIAVQVQDTGIGISAAHLPHIFNRFYQADDSRTRAYEGTGIGLALVKELTALLNGTIAVDSRTEPPSGTTVTLHLPVAAVPVLSDALPVSAPTPPLVGQGIRRQTDPATDHFLPGDPLVVVVDDNAELKTFIAGELADSYRVLTASDGEEGWQLIQDELPDLVISDVMMPRMDGYQLTHCIKSTALTNHIAVILLTAKAAHQSRITGLEQGADDYLTKPFHMDELYLRIQNLLTHRQTIQQYYHQQLTSVDSAFQPVQIDDSFLKNVYAYIESRLDDSSLTVDELAKRHNMSRRTMHRKLTSLTNLSANDLIRQYRLRRAAELLRAGYSVAQTAYSVGFESPTYFSTLFKQTYQQSPTDFVGR